MVALLPLPITLNVSSVYAPVPGPHTGAPPVEDRWMLYAMPSTFVAGSVIRSPTSFWVGPPS